MHNELLFQIARSKVYYHDGRQATSVSKENDICICMYTSYGPLLALKWRVGERMFLN